jgi:hypothetical protein
VPHVVVAGGRAASEDDGVLIHVGTVDDAVARPTILGEDHVAACPLGKLDKMLRSSGDITYKRVRPPRVRAIEDVGVHQSLSMEEDDHPDRSRLACAHEVLRPPHVARGREYMVTQMG